jgi:glycosyltransferase involved in cell wall biosynthesis
MKVVVAQKGSREHFAIARALHLRSSLARLVVDWYAPQPGLARLLLHCLPRRILQRAMAAQAPGLPPELIQSLNGFGLWRRIPEAWSRKRRCPYEGDLNSGRMFARKAASLSLPPHDVFFGYSYESLEVLQAEKDRGVLTLVDQVDPGEFEAELVMEEAERWKSYAIGEAKPPAAYFSRNRQEWETADVIIVNSQWCKQALIAAGAPEHKLEILPLAYEENIVDPRRPMNHHTGNLQVLWLGTVCLRKGIQYLMEAAKLLDSQPIEFLVGGSVRITDSSVRNAPRNVKFLGQIPRSQTHAFYLAGDVFVLPTVSDGFALTQLEALAHGLPIVVTPNCGSVVEDGATGFIVPPRDSKALAQALLRFVHDRTLTTKMRPRCQEAVQAFSLAQCGARLADLISKARNRQDGPPHHLCQV